MADETVLEPVADGPQSVPSKTGHADTSTLLMTNVRGQAGGAWAEKTGPAGARGSGIV